MGYVLLFLKNVSPEKQTKKVFKCIRDVPSAFNVSTATDYNFKATELNEQKKNGFFLYIYLIFISVFLDF